MRLKNLFCRLSRKKKSHQNLYLKLYISLIPEPEGEREDDQHHDCIPIRLSVARSMNPTMPTSAAARIAAAKSADQIWIVWP